MFELAQAALRLAGADMRSVARTWLWLGDILDWYDGLNQVRRDFFRRCGLIGGPGDQPRLPASTGIGVRPAGPATCSMDLRAVCPPAGVPLADGELIQHHHAAGMQDSPYRYGSAFSRAATAVSPAGQGAGRTLFVSGSAAIDPSGASCCPGDARGQIEMTLRHVRAILAEHGCGDDDVVQAMAYCKTPEAMDVWRAEWADAPWPTVSLIADVCRPELLFELELTACPGVRRVGG
jgi:enamine deaminase RidA (YjgF/YER057c/UK114 family)